MAQQVTIIWRHYPVVAHKYKLMFGVRRWIPADAPSEVGFVALEKGMAAFLVHEINERYDEAFAAKDWAAVEHHIIQIDVQSVLAVSALFSTDRYAPSTDAAAYVAVNVVPTEQHTITVFSYLREQRAQMVEALGRVGPAARLSSHMSCKSSRCANVKTSRWRLGISIVWGGNKQETIREYFERNTGGHEWECDDPD